jgi:hypothetical protein
MEEDRTLARTLLYDGQKGMREAGTSYLPKYEGESGDANTEGSEYQKRLSRTFLVNFYQDAVYNIVGRVFQKPLVLSEDMPDRIRELWTNIDNCGTHGDVFVHDACIDSLGQGHTEVLVDFQDPGEEFDNQSVEELAGVRPKWINWRVDTTIEALERVINGRPYLERFRVREDNLRVEGYEYSVEKTVREYMMGELGLTDAQGKSVEQFASYRIHVLQNTDDGDIWVPGDWSSMEPSRQSSPEQRAMFIEPPIVPFYGLRRGFHFSKPPLTVLADLNEQHWQKKSDLDNIERIANIPVLVLEGGDGDTSNLVDLEIGAYRIIGIPEDQILKYLEIQGNGIAHLKESIVHLEHHIRRVGKEPTSREATGTELATVRMLDEAKTLSLAQVWAISWVASINRCLDLTAAWLGLPTGGSVSIEEDVMASLSNPDAFGDVMQLLAAGAISSEGALTEAKRYGVLGSDFNVEEDVEKQDTQTPTAII